MGLAINAHGGFPEQPDGGDGPVLGCIASGLGAHDRQAANRLRLTQPVRRDAGSEQLAERAGQLLRGRDKHGGPNSTSFSPAKGPTAGLRLRSMGNPNGGHLTRAVVALSLLTAAGRTLVGHAKRLPELVLAVALAAVLLCLVWFFTTRRPS